MNSNRFGKVAVLMGGRSAEREISMLSGSAVLGALRERSIDAHAFDPKERAISDLKLENFDCAFIALHGRYGEDGTVQGALELLGIPYTGSGVMASSLAMDKWRTKLMWRSVGIPVPKDVLVHETSDWNAVVRSLGLPLIVKPVHEGSTIGLTKVRTVKELPAAYELAARHDRTVLAEEFIEGRELTASILGDAALPLIRIDAPQGNYDYQNKYFSDETKYHCPAGISAESEQTIREVALHSFRVLGCEGWGRADLILRADDTFSFLEMNTSPGMTGHSLVPMAARQAGLDFPDLVVRILEGAHVG
ncbi:MAG: D-alanine--D-alanine ligase [Prolixibacteraceae bacterium]|nr:D-alanine--D-alanine ligase [Burkholderiales bacterium]